MAKSPYPASVRAEALALAAEVGFVAAGAQLSLNAATIRSWARRSLVSAEAAGVEVVLPQNARGVAASWSERAPVLLDGFSQAAGEALQASRQAVKAGKARDAKDYAITAAIATEKALLLGGQATSRSENYSIHAEAEAVISAELDEDIRALKAELELEEGGDPDDG
jgi:hypothetical protein